MHSISPFIHWKLWHHFSLVFLWDVLFGQLQMVCFLKIICFVFCYFALQHPFTAFYIEDKSFHLNSNNLLLLLLYLTGIVHICSLRIECFLPLKVSGNSDNVCMVTFSLSVSSWIGLEPISIKSN